MRPFLGGARARLRHLPDDPTLVGGGDGRMIRVGPNDVGRFVSETATCPGKTRAIIRKNSSSTEAWSSQRCRDPCVRGSVARDETIIITEITLLDTAQSAMSVTQDRESVTNVGRGFISHPAAFCNMQVTARRLTLHATHSAPSPDLRAG